MDDLDTELTMLEERIVELREDSMRQKSFQSSTPVTTHTNNKVRDSGVGKTRFSGEFQQMKDKSLSPDNAPVKHTNTFVKTSTGKTPMDMYRYAGAIPRIFSNCEPIPNVDRYQEPETAHPNKYRIILPPTEHYQIF
jgi:hypothetical protein